MVVRNKLYRVFDKYRSLLKKEAKKQKGSRQHSNILRGVVTKNKVLDFYVKNNRWPNRRSDSKKERKLGQVFENYVSKEAASYDSRMRRIAMTTGRTTNNKRKHNVAGFKQEILEFIKTNGRSPMRSTYRKDAIKGEDGLRGKLDRYTLELKDMTFLGQVYDSDPCHRSGIPSKFRSIINEALNTEKPLIRLV